MEMDITTSIDTFCKLNHIKLIKNKCNCKLSIVFNQLKLTYINFIFTSVKYFKVIKYQFSEMITVKNILINYGQLI